MFWLLPHDATLVPSWLSKLCPSVTRVFSGQKKELTAKVLVMPAFLLCLAAKNDIEPRHVVHPNDVALIICLIA